MDCFKKFPDDKLPDKWKLLKDEYITEKYYLHAIDV